MQSNTSSQCQLFQLHIDAYLDDELETARTTELRNHLQQCQACSQELAYAERLHRAVVSLPILDCSDHALEPVDRLFTASGQRDDEKFTGGFWSGLGRVIGALPASVRLGIPVAASVLLVVGLGRELLVPMGSPGAELAVQPVSETPEIEYSPAEIRQAFQDLELAMDYLGRISERTEVMIQDRFLLRQLEDSINASFTTDPLDEPEDNTSDGPI